jgi:hypothetical protein
MTLITNKISKKKKQSFLLLAFEKGAYVEKISPNKLRLNKVKHPVKNSYLSADIKDIK